MLSTGILGLIEMIRVESDTQPCYFNKSNWAPLHLDWYAAQLGVSKAIIKKNIEVPELVYLLPKDTKLNKIIVRPELVDDASEQDVHELLQAIYLFEWSRHHAIKVEHVKEILNQQVHKQLMILLKSWGARDAAFILRAVIENRSLLFDLGSISNFVYGSLEEPNCYQPAWPNLDTIVKYRSLGPEIANLVELALYSEFRARGYAFPYRSDKIQRMKLAAELDRVSLAHT
jgi:hypothetical protein